MKGRHETTPAKASTAHFENPADAEAAKTVAEGLAAGVDVFGDFDDEATSTSTAAAPAPAAAAADATDAGASADEAGQDLDDAGDTASQEAAAAAAEDAAAAQAAEASRQAANEADQAAKATPDQPAAQAQAQAPQPFKVKSAQELAEAEKALMTEKAEAFEKYSNGTMTAAEYSEVDSRVMKGLIALASETALANANAQTALQASEQALANVKQLAKTQGLDYDANQEAATQFDNVVEMLSKDPVAAALSDADFFSKAHATVLLLRGMTPTAQAPAPAPAAAAKPRQDMTGPITLRQIPAAATPNATGGVVEQLSRLDGLDFEDAVGVMPRQQRDQWLDS